MVKTIIAVDNFYTHYIFQYAFLQLFQHQKQNCTQKEINLMSFLPPHLSERIIPYPRLYVKPFLGFIPKYFIFFCFSLFRGPKQAKNRFISTKLLTIEQKKNRPTMKFGRFKYVNFQKNNIPGSLLISLDTEQHCDRHTDEPQAYPEH